MFNRTIRFIPALSLYVATSLSPLFAASAAETVSIDDAWVRAVPPVSETSAAFMQIHNTSANDYALVSAESTASRLVELHTHETDENGVHRMFQVEKIAIPANGSAQLQPGGYHVMLIGLAAPVKEGESIAITLVFDDGSKSEIMAPVKKMQMPEMQMDHSKHKHH